MSDKSHVCESCERQAPADELLLVYRVADPWDRYYVHKPGIVPSGYRGGPCFRRVGAASEWAIEPACTSRAQPCTTVH